MEDKSIKRKKPSAVPGILSLASVMFILGILGTSILGFKEMGKFWLENSSIDVYFQDNIDENFVKKFQKEMSQKTWVNKTQFVSREQGIKEMGDKYDPDFMNYVESVTLPLSLEIYPKAEYANTAFLSDITHYLKKNPAVEDVVFQKNWLDAMTENIRKIQFAIGSLALILIVISMILIQSSVRLGIFANRLTIKSMQLVGATNSFIILPFIKKFIGYALIATPVAGLAIFAIFWGIPTIWNNELQLLKSFTEHLKIEQLIILSLAITIFGVSLAAFGSWYSTRKFLKTKIENLY